MTLHDQLDEFLAWMKSGNDVNPYSEHSIRAYKKGICYFIDFLVENDINELTEVDHPWIKHFFRKLNSLSLSPASTRQIMSSVYAFLEHTHLDSDDYENPVKLFRNKQSAQKLGGRVVSRLPPVLYPNEQEELIYSVSTKNHSNCSRDLAIIGLMLDSGIRTSELCNLTLYEVSNLIENGTLRIIGKGNKERVVKPLSNHICLLKDYVKEIRNDTKNNDLVFMSMRKTPLKQPVIHRMISERLKQSGVIKPQMGGHLLRHTAASMMLNSGMNIKQVQENMGHSSIVTTEKYMHLI